MLNVEAGYDRERIGERKRVKRSNKILLTGHWRGSASPGKRTTTFR